jgi:hypothetical protein
MRVGLQLLIKRFDRPPFKAEHAVRKNKLQRALCRLLTSSLSQAGIQQLSSKSHGLLGKLSSKSSLPVAKFAHEESCGHVRPQPPYGGLVKTSTKSPTSNEQTIFGPIISSAILPYKFDDRLVLRTSEKQEK